MSQLALIGLDDDELAADIRAKFAELTEVDLVGIETTSNDLISAVGEELNLDVVLVHESLGPMPVGELIKDLTLRHPQLAIVLIVDDPTPDAFAQAMEAGARGVVSRDAPLDELSARVLTAAEWSQNMRRHLDASHDGPLPGRRGTMIAISGAKGGTGTTTLAVHLAMAASAARRTVCLVDLDLQTGDVNGFLDITHRRSVADLVEAADDINGTVLADALFVHKAGPHILLAPQDGERAEDVTSRATRQILNALRSRYEVIVIDCGSHLTEASAMALEGADRVVLTATPDLPALRAARRTVKMWGRLNVRKDDDLAILLVKQSRKNEVQPDFARKILKLPLLKFTVPAVFRELEESINTANPSAVDEEGFRKAIGLLAAETGAVEAADNEAEKGKSGRRGAGDAGQGVIEFVGLIPSVLALLFLMMQVCMFGMALLYTGHAANEAAHRLSIAGGAAGQYVEKDEEQPQHRRTWKLDDKSDVKKIVLKRISPPWNKNEHVEVFYPTWREHPQAGRVIVTIDAPVILPWLQTDWWKVSSTAKVTPEGQLPTGVV
ncbi:MAG: AAA family ATPase [Streptosporangiales bacterium]|nr:AAA family ATPase [Streptosporangiales bacterium]